MVSIQLLKKPGNIWQYTISHEHDCYYKVHRLNKWRVLYIKRYQKYFVSSFFNNFLWWAIWPLPRNESFATSAGPIMVCTLRSTGPPKRRPKFTTKGSNSKEINLWFCRCCTVGFKLVLFHMGWYFLLLLLKKWLNKMVETFFFGSKMLADCKCL